MPSHTLQTCCQFKIINKVVEHIKLLCSEDGCNLLCSNILTTDFIQSITTTTVIIARRSHGQEFKVKLDMSTPTVISVTTVFVGPCPAPLDVYGQRKERRGGQSWMVLNLLVTNAIIVMLACLSCFNVQR
uniref:Uncharacterized protein n=1 Tax=Lygus hesperus TaxID=30085 RepID=A0A146LAQ1_LYGHE